MVTKNEEFKSKAATAKTAMVALQQATAAALAEIEDGRATIVLKRGELKALKTAPPPLAEAEGRAPAIVRELGAAWLQEHGARVMSSYQDGSRALGELRDRGRIRLPWGGTPADPGDLIPFGALACGDPAAAERLLVGILRARYAQGVQAGPPLADRPRLIADCERAIAALEREDEERTDEATRAGLNVEPRADVVKARHEAGERMARAAELERERSGRLAAIDRAADSVPA